MNRHLIYTVFACMLIMLAVSCDDDCPTCPPPPEEIISDYNVILGANEFPFYVYNTKKMAIVDTIDINPITRYRGLAVNGDGRHLLVSDGDWEWGGMMVLDLETYDTIKTFATSGWLNVSNTGKYVVFISGGRTHFLNGHTYEIIDSLDNAYGRGSFTWDDRKYCFISSGSVINIYDMESRSLDTSFIYADNNGLSPSLLRIQVDHTCRKFYLVAAYGVYYLVAYSMDYDSTTLVYPIANPANGDLQITPDGKQIIYTDPGYLFFDEPGTGHIIFFDASTDAVISIVDAPRAIVSSQLGPYGFMPGWLAITPDSRYTIVAAAGLGNAVFGMIDNIQHRFVDIQTDTIPPITMWNFTVSCQKLLK